MMQLSNEELFQRYGIELALKIRNQRNLRYDRQLLEKFRNYIGDLHPSPSLVKGFIAQYSDRSPATQARYAATLKAFMKWYGQPMDGFRIKVPRALPQYVEDAEIDRLIRAIEDKRSHKGSITRDRLMVELYLKTGMRRGELSNLEKREIHADFLMVRKGKGQKDRMIPLLPDLARRLGDFTKDKRPDEKVFGLTSAGIGNKIRALARKAGLPNIHTHSFRHKYATDLLERVNCPPRTGPVIVSDLDEAPGTNVAKSEWSWSAGLSNSCRSYHRDSQFGADHLREDTSIRAISSHQ